MSICILLGIVLIVMIQDIDVFIHNISELVLLIDQGQMLSIDSIATYFSLLICAGMAGYALESSINKGINYGIPLGMH
ncbi:MAG: hypothetical protein LBQ01_02890, partial [Prevotellaceae bacterium]|nr:hypothetical protein [Prevotellaceae bacterium]